MLSEATIRDKAEYFETKMMEAVHQSSEYDEDDPEHAALSHDIEVYGLLSLAMRMVIEDFGPLDAVMLIVGLVGRDRFESVFLGEDPRLDFWREALKDSDL